MRVDGRKTPLSLQRGKLTRKIDDYGIGHRLLGVMNWCPNDNNAEIRTGWSQHDLARTAASSSYR